MSRAYIAHADFVSHAKAGTVPAHVVLRKQFLATIEKANGGEPRTRTFIVSTAAVDRDNDTINPKGWRLDNYRKNPVVLFAHDYSSLPVGKCTGIKSTGDQLIGSVEFADHDMANTVLRLIDGGFLTATSVGFRPTKYQLNETRKGVDYEEQELLEFSIVPVPANPEALIVARELVGDVKLLREWALKMLDVTKADEKPKPKPGEEPPETPVDDETKKPDMPLEDPPADGNGDEPDGDEEDVNDPDAKKAIAAAVAEIALALKELPARVAREITGGGTDRTDDQIKRGRVLSAKNEAKVRAAHCHLDEVLKCLPGMEDATTAPDVIATKATDDDIDLDTIEAGGIDVDIDVDDNDIAAAVKDSLRELVAATVGDIVKTETQSAMNRARGRLD